MVNRAADAAVRRECVRALRCRASPCFMRSLVVFEPFADSVRYINGVRDVDREGALKPGWKRGRETPVARLPRLLCYRGPKATLPPLDPIHVDAGGSVSAPPRRAAGVQPPQECSVETLVTLVSLLSRPGRCSTCPAADQPTVRLYNVQVRTERCVQCCVASVHVSACRTYAFQQPVLGGATA